MTTLTLKQLPWRRVIKFLITGGSALALDFIVYFLLTRFAHIPYLVSRTISLGLAMIWSFTVNRNWTFQATGGKVNQQVVRYLIVMISTSLLSLFLMRFGVATLHLHDLLVVLVVAALITIINFVAHQFWTYANQG